MTGWPGGFAHTPYDGSHRPFTIGMGLLDLADWIEVDSDLERYLDEKERLIAADRDAVFREEAATRDAQAEVLALLAAHLPQRFPDIFRREGSRMHIAPAGRSVALDGGEAPLLTAARLVQEDLVLMREGEGGHRLAAASVSFPSSWSLAEKFGKTLDGLHGPVPGYADLMAGRVNRIFAHLQADKPVKRFGWLLYADDELHHPRPGVWPDGAEQRAFLRIERQTLRRLPQSGDILFTVRIHIDPLAALRDHPDGAQLAAGIRDALLNLTEAQLAYRGLSAAKARLVAQLETIAGAGNG